jgi:hypothetical protein
MERCNMCGRPVASFFDHVDVDCLNWPEPDATLPVVYRGFSVDTTMFQCMGSAYAWVHEDYDGPEDNRHGSEATVEDCYRSIDEWHEENA